MIEAIKKALLERGISSELADKALKEDEYHVWDSWINPMLDKIEEFIKEDSDSWCQYTNCNILSYTKVNGMFLCFYHAEQYEWFLENAKE